MTPSGQPYDVLFVGTNQGKILKIVNTAGAEDNFDESLNFSAKTGSTTDTQESTASRRPVLVEEIVAFPKNVVIRKLDVIKARGSLTGSGKVGSQFESLRFCPQGALVPI